MKQQHVTPSLAITSLVMIFLGSALFSFSEKIGGDHFSIHLNEKLLLQVYVTQERGLNNITLASAHPSDVLRVRYSHCGKTGTERSLAIQDSEKKVLKRWSFTGSALPEMTVSMQEILSASTNSPDEKLQLIYSSSEIPEGRVLTAISLAEGVHVSLK